MRAEKLLRGSGSKIYNSTKLCHKFITPRTGVGEVIKLQSKCPTTCSGKLRSFIVTARNIYSLLMEGCDFYSLENGLIAMNFKASYQYGTYRPL